ncbi:MAG TPA: outer membrane protein assembly factor BamD [Candidatus Krumholzibacteria bacterium]|nr:outer membrane protein assembly factor BamD [Candidatus Krumholzibacteria bacterium]
MSTRIGIFVAAVLLTGAIGCSHPGSGLPVGSYERGIAEYEGERYLDAVQTLRLYVRRNPTDPRVDEAQYHIGLARFENDEYAVAAVEFEILRNDYPNSELIEDAWIMEGMCYVEQVPSIHHEQSVTRRALDHFLRYLQEFPDGERSADAREQVDALRLHLDRKWLSNIRLYERLGRTEAALVEAEAMLDDRPDSQLRPEVLMLAADLHAELDQLGEARRLWRRILDDHGSHELAPQAQSKLARMRDGVDEDAG